MIDGQITIVLGKRFMEEHPKIAQIKAAHELIHVDDILRLGYETARRAVTTARAAVELSVQNRALGKIMVHYETIGQPLPAEIMAVHLDYLYSKGGWATQLAKELNDWLKNDNK
jgi:hypothetical protein